MVQNVSGQMGVIMAWGRASLARRNRVIRLSLLAITIAASAKLVLGEGPPDLEKWLAKPMSPASIAMLVEHAKDERVVARWSEALSDGAPEAWSPSSWCAPRGAALLGISSSELGSVATEGPAPPSSAASAPLTARMVTDLPPGLLRSVIVESGCRLHDGEWGGGRVWWRSDGRSARIRRLNARLSGECEAAVRVLLLMELASERGLWGGGKPQSVVIPFNKDFVECESDWNTAQRAVERLGSSTAGQPADRESKITPPRKKKDVKPVYSESAVQARARGVVKIEAILSRQGCVMEARTLSSDHDALSLHALLAVVRWRYEPALLNGVPVPIIMSVTVNFSLEY
jgi:TonB family protein